jgi:hypothetical protein
MMYHSWKYLSLI